MLITILKMYSRNDDIMERLKMLRVLTLIRIERNKNKILFQYIDRLTIKTVHVIKEKSEYIAYISALILVLLLSNE